MATAHQPVATDDECRQCCSFCDRLVHPSGCIDAGCAYVYVYDDERSGRRYMGCMRKVYKVEIDVDLFERVERTRNGFGGVKLAGDPLPQCRLSVERAYHGNGEAFDCTNPSFFGSRASDQRASRSFDLRDSL